MNINRTILRVFSPFTWARWILNLIFYPTGTLIVYLKSGQTMVFHGVFSFEYTKIGDGYSKVSWKAAESIMFPPIDNIAAITFKNLTGWTLTPPPKKPTPPPKD